jgi:hypothetical protein
MRKGFIQAATDGNFVVIETKTGAAITVTYQEVRQVKGHNLSKGTWVVIGVGTTLATLLVIWLIVASSDLTESEV